jgi:hypothetical protein
MSGRGEAVRRISPSEPASMTPAEPLPTVWSPEEDTLAEQTRRVIDEAREEISRSIRKQFEPAE